MVINFLYKPLSFLQLIIPPLFMKILFSLIFILLAAFIASAYGTVYQLSGALQNNHVETLQKLLDIPVIQENYQKTIKQQLNTGLIGKMIGSGETAQAIRNTMQSLTNVGVKQAIDKEWVRDVLAKNSDGNYRAITDSLSFAFFESPQLFLVRLGELGQSPQHFYLSWQAWHFPNESNQLSWGTWLEQYALHRWRLTAIYQ